MSREILGLNYKEGQIIKHALQHYTKREHPKKHSDIQEENQLLGRVEEFVDEYKKYIGIKR